MINVDDRILDALSEQEFWLAMHIVKRMKSNRMTSWPSIETLAKDCSWDERTVKKYRAELIAKGWLNMEQKPGKPPVYSFKKSGFGVHIPMEEHPAQEEEPPTLHGGAQNVPPTLHGGAFCVEKGGHKMYPELINKEVINNSVANATAGASQTAADVQHVPSVTPLSIGAANQNTTAIGAYTFEQFWDDYGFKKGSKKNARAKWNKLSASDISAIVATLETYKRQTVTDDAGRDRDHFKPMRKHPEFFISGRMWESIADQISDLHANEVPSEYDEKYKIYLDWVSRKYPEVWKRSLYFTRDQFVAYKTYTYVRKAIVMGEEKNKQYMSDAHANYLTSDHTGCPDVFSLMAKYTKDCLIRTDRYK